MPGSPPVDIVRWALLLPSDEPIIVLVVDDSHDDGVAGIVAREGMVPSDNFGGVWGTGQRDGHWVLAFRLIELGAGDDGLERSWLTDNIHRPLLDAILTVPHLVAVMPAEIAGDFKAAEDLIPRLGGALLVGVGHRSPQVAHVLAEREDD